MGNNTQQQFSIDPEAFRKAANVTRGVSDKLSGIWNDLATGLDALGKPWGTDKIGNQFASGDSNNGYTSSITGMREGIVGPKGFCASINGVADGQDSTADYVQNQIEAENAATYTGGGQ